MLVTAPDAVLPADGAIVVRRHEVVANRMANDEQWTVKDGNGHAVTVAAEVLGGGYERWLPAGPAERDLVIFNGAGKRVAKLHQTATKSPALQVLRAASAKSTLSMDDLRKFEAGVPGGATTLELAQDLPAEAQLFIVAITGSAPRAYTAIAPTTERRKFEWASYAHKSCARGGLEPLVIGEHIALTWIDSVGRRSAVTALTVGRRPPPK
ncbi:MAG: hypothetical protein ABI647_26450 [Gemmatimonadota bacterium]